MRKAVCLLALTLLACDDSPEELPEEPTPASGDTLLEPIAELQQVAPADEERADDYLDPTPAVTQPAVLLSAPEPVALQSGDGDACVAPQFMTGTDEGTFPGVPLFKTPNRAFASEADARAFLTAARAKLPFYLPYSHPDVRLGQGWIYDRGTSHRGLDFHRGGVPADEDSTFVVRAMAPGRVLVVTYRPGGGNGVFIEHTFPDGTKAISVHYHLRNGHDHDVAQALALTCKEGDTRCQKYKLFATKYADHQSWGTNSQTILVKAGDLVKAGQALGWSGNTGVGGAAAGLDDDGSPKSTHGNVHLHMYFAVESPAKDAFVYIDPYAVYEKVSTGCYGLEATTEFPRFVAPFFANFHNLPADRLLRHFGYFADMGWSPRTLSLHRAGDELRASGSFQPGIPGKWRMRIGLDVASFQAWADTYWAEGLVPRETTVTLAADGTPRFHAVWRPLAAGEHVVHRGQLTDAAWSSLWSSLIGDGYRVADYFPYRAGGTDYHLALYTDAAARPFYFFRDRDAADLQAKIDWGFTNGYAPVLLRASESGRFTAALRQVPGCWKWYVGLTAAQYQSKASTLISKGYRVESLQGYADSARFAAIFHIPVDAAPAVCP